VTFEFSADGTNYSKLGNGTRITSGWQLGGLSLPLKNNFWLRGRGRSVGGFHDGSSGLVESVRQFYVPGNAPVISGSREAGTSDFIISFPYTSGFGFEVLSTTNLNLPLGDWTVLGPVREFAPRQYQFIHLNAIGEPQSFYRLRSP
jgi:hypothetical protein